MARKKPGKQNFTLHSKPVGTASLADKADLNKGMAAQAIKTKQARRTGSFARTHYRTPIAMEKRAELEHLFKRFIYVKTEGNFLPQLFKSSPRTLKNVILGATQCDLESIYICGDSLRIVCKIELKKLTQIDGKKLEWSEPHALTRQLRTRQRQEQRQEVSYGTKGVIYGLEEDDDVLEEIASEIGAK